MKAKLRPAQPNYEKLDGLQPKATQETRIERQIRNETRLAYEHYNHPERHRDVSGIPACPECQRIYRNVAYSLSRMYFPLKIKWGSR